MRGKVSIIGAGNVGATTAQFVVQSGIADVVLFDIVEGLPQGKALDIAEACPLWNSSSTIKGTNNYSDTANSDVIVITAGLPRKPGMSRDDLLQANANIVREVCTKIAKTSPDAIIIVVTNPMDVMTYLAWKASSFHHKKVIGMGGILDSVRFRRFIAWELDISPEDVDALVIGSHGDQMVPLPRFTTAKGVSITELLKKNTIETLIQRTRKGGVEIVDLLKTGSAYYAPAASVFQMVKSILLDEKRMLLCSVYLNKEYGIKDIYAGVPVIVGKEGVEKIIELKLSKGEKTQFRESCAAIRRLIKKLSI